MPHPFARFERSGVGSSAAPLYWTAERASPSENIPVSSVLESDRTQTSLRWRRTRRARGNLPLTAEMLLTEPSGNLFGLSQNAGMGWDPARLLDPEFLILSTHGGLRAENGEAIALGFHTGHWEVGLLVAEAARELKSLRATPFAGACTDPCDGRTQGTTGMMDSLPFRNDAAIVLRRLMRSLPTRQRRDRHGHLRQGAARDDDGAGVVGKEARGAGSGRRNAAAGIGRGCGEGADHRRALCAEPDHAGICRRGGLPSVRFAGRRVPVSGNRGHIAGGGRGAGASLPHTALAPSGQPIWLDAARRSARAILRLHELGIGTGDILTPASIYNAMIVKAAFGGSTNLLHSSAGHCPCGGLQRPTVADWVEVNRLVPRLVDALPNGPRNFATVQVFLAGGVPEVMLELREARATGREGKNGERRNAGHVPGLVAVKVRAGRSCAAGLQERDGIDPEDVIMSPDRARSRGLTSAVCFPMGNLAPEGSVVKSTAIDPSLVGEDKVLPAYRARAGFCDRSSSDPSNQDWRNYRGRRNCAHLQRARGRGHAGDLPDHRGAEATAALQARSGVDRCTLQRRVDGCVHRPYLARGAGRRAHRQGARRRPDRDRDRSQEACGSVHLVGEAGEIFGAEEGSRRLAERKPRARSCAASRITRRYAPLGRAGAGERRRLGRMRLRCGSIISRLEKSA